MVRIVLTNASFLKESGLWEDGELEITSRSVHFSGKKTEIRKNYSDLDQIAASVEEYEKKKLFRKSIEKWLGLSFSDGTMWFFKFEDDHFADSICRQIDLEREKETEAKRQAELQAQKQAEIAESVKRTTDSATRAIPMQNRDDPRPEAVDKEETSSRSAKADIQDITSSISPESVEPETTEEKYSESDKEITLANAVKQSEKSSPQKEKKAGKKKINLKNATHDLVAETQALLDTAAKARKEADELYDELKKLSQSGSDPDIDQKEIQSTNDHIHSEMNAPLAISDDIDDIDTHEQDSERSATIIPESSIPANNGAESNASAPVETISQTQATAENDNSTSATSQLKNDEFSDAATADEKDETNKGSGSTEDVSSAQWDSAVITTEKETFADNEAGEKQKTEEIVESEFIDGSITPSEQSEEGIQEEQPLQGQSNINFRKKFVHECIEFARACTEYIPENRVTKKTTQSESYLFDLMNVCYSQMDEAYVMHPMPTYIAPGGKLIKCREDGIYADKLITAYEPFLNNAAEYQNEVIRRSLNDSVGRRSSAFSSMQLLCLMPDVVDDFSSFFRNQLEINGQRVFQIPRSIALAYAAQQVSLSQGVQLPKEFLCLDYDGEEFIAIKIRQETDKSGDTIFVRMGRYPIQEHHPVYKTLALSYLTEYKKKYNVPFTKKMTHDLVDTKKLQHLLLSTENRPALVTDGETSIDVWIDNEILESLLVKIADDSKEISKNNSIPVFALCSFGKAANNGIFGVDMLELGCKEITKRYAEGKTLWEEYLPSLQLGVHQDGTFADLDLISEKDRHQQIVSSYIGKTVEIIIQNGTIVLTKDKDHYDLPLVREVYGSMNKEKLARFKPEEPLTEDTEVELRIYYTYGDVDSYRLVALCSDGTKIESKWCDSELLPNPAPSYTSKDETITMAQCDRIYQAFLDFTHKVQSPTPPFRSTIYFDNSKHTYSRYLYGLNERYWPFFPIQNYFRDSNYSQAKEQIDDLIRFGVFKAVADVMNGSLPVGHNLEAEKYSPEKGDNTNAARVLRINITEIARLFGKLYTIKAKNGKRYEDVAQIVEAFRNNKSRTPVENWAPLTAYVKRNDDQYGIWDGFIESLYTLNPKHPHIYSLRAISSVSYQTEDWIFEFYKGPQKKKDLDHLLKNIYACLDDDEWKQAKNLPYNPRKIRDVLELLLCICRLKSVDEDVLNCNSAETKSLVLRLKKIDADMRDLQRSGQLKKEFNTRLGIQLPYEYRFVNRIIYSLVQTLTGGDVVSLVGFKEDGAR